MRLSEAVAGLYIQCCFENEVVLAAGCWQADLPALKPEAPATRSPRFLMMKLLPMKTLLLTARASPTVCSFISRHYMLI